jgi:hypothetical protein
VKTHPTCSHLVASPQQGMALLPNEHCQETFYCAPCAAERLEAILRASTPSDAARSVVLNRCGHFDNEQRCGVCYTALLGSLMLTWSWYKVHAKGNGQGEASRTGNRLRTTIQMIVARFGAVPFGRAINNSYAENPSSAHGL